jgi:hypothetical protein
MKDNLSSQGLSVSGTKHEMFIDAVTRDISPAPPMLDAMDITGIRKTYKCLFGKPPIKSESGLRNDMLAWLDFTMPTEVAAPSTYPGIYVPPTLFHTQDSLIAPLILPLSGDSTDASRRSSTKHDVAISYASEDEANAKAIAEAMKEAGLRVFFAPYEQAQLWGKKLSDAFKEDYASRAMFVLVLVSQHYALKDFTNFEFTIARDEARKRKEEFILPVRLDQTPIVGLHSDVGYIDYGKVGAKEVARLMKQKVTARTPIIPTLRSTKLHWPDLTKKD